MRYLHLLRLLIISVIFVTGSFTARAAIITIEGISYNVYTQFGEAYVNGCSKDVKVARILNEVEYEGRKFPVTKITGGFSNLPKLEEIYIPSSITTVSYSSIRSLDNLKKSEFESLESMFLIDFEGDSPVMYSHNVFIDGEEITEITVPSSITKIFPCLEGATNIRSIKIHGGVTVIYYAAFSGCTGLEEVDLGEGLDFLDYDIFKDCTSLTHISFPESIT